MFAVMHHIVYISAATKDMDSLALQEILGSARESNRRNQITGFLMYHDGQFFQVLEGSEDALRQCFEKICQDTRHKGIIKLLDQPCDERSFSNWNMGLTSLTQFDESAQGHFIDVLNAHEAGKLNELHRDKIISVFANTFLSNIKRLRNSIR